MTQLNSEIYPDEPDKLPPARRRRTRRLLAPLDADERAIFLYELAHRASPTFDFYLFSILSGIVISIGLILDAPPFLLMGALLAPIMAPIIGMSLGAITGTITHFLRNLLGFLTGSVLVFLIGVGSGMLIYVLPGFQNSSRFTQAVYYCQLSWGNFLLLSLGAIWTSVAMSKNDRLPALPSIAIAYELFLPLVAAGIGLGTSLPHLWPDGLIVFAIYLSWAVLIGVVTLAIIGFRPLTLFGYTLSGVVALIGITLLIGLSSAGFVIGGKIALPTPKPSATLTVTPTITLTQTPRPPTSTTTPTRTTIPTTTYTMTPIPSPTPFYAMVFVSGSTGAYLRSKPEGEILKSYLNGTIVEILPEIELFNGVIWVRVRTPDGKEGWMVHSLLVTPLPTPTG